MEENNQMFQNEEGNDSLQKAPEGSFEAENTVTEESHAFFEKPKDPMPQQTGTANAYSQPTGQDYTSGQQNQKSNPYGGQQPNDNPYEQQPSRLYGRTAYQNQQAANQNYSGQNQNQYNPYGGQNQYNSYGSGNQGQYQNPYGAPNQPYGNQNGYQNNYQNNYQNFYQNQPVHGKVSDIFCNVLLVVMPLAAFVSMLATNMVFKIMDGMSYDDFYSSYYSEVMRLAETPGYTMLSLLSNLLTILYIVFVVIDIVKIHKENYKITGLILFAIFLRPGYYIWRAHILGRDKKLPIIYTVAFSVLLLGEFIWIFARMYQIILNMLSTMPLY